MRRRRRRGGWWRGRGQRTKTDLSSNPGILPLQILIAFFGSQPDRTQSGYWCHSYRWCNIRQLFFENCVFVSFYRCVQCVLLLSLHIVFFTHSAFFSYPYIQCSLHIARASLILQPLLLSPLHMVKIPQKLIFLIFFVLFCLLLFFRCFFFVFFRIECSSLLPPYSGNSTTVFQNNVFFSLPATYGRNSKVAFQNSTFSYCCIWWKFDKCFPEQRLLLFFLLLPRNSTAVFQNSVFFSYPPPNIW